VTSNSENNFWLYSKTHYARPGVSTYCLQCQDIYGGNVNILLFCSWLGYRSIEISIQDLVEACGEIEQWDLSVVQPLRKVRKYIAESEIATSKENTIVSLKKLELTSEKTEQDVLYRWSLSQNFKTCDTIGIELQINNINKYLAILDAPILSAEHPLLSHTNFS